MLCRERNHVVRDLKIRVGDLLAKGASGPPTQDSAERADVDTQDDIGFVVTELKSQALQTIDAALARLKAGTYGRCMDCDDALPDSRLRALPYAVRCRDCENQRESALRRGGLVRRPAYGLFQESV
jgi:RNA polymerase-binding transcription factor DksA